MIVKKNTSALEEAYNNLFIESYQYLEQEGLLREDEVGKDSFQSLPEYYSHMNDFFSKEAWKYIFLPLDEKVFEIELNSRNIVVPSDFSKLVSVQSDQLAEMIVFSVDRYFDYMDLANTSIYVQWRLPDGTENATRIFMIDLSTPDKIRFAWPISDIITNQTGTVKFSVRFFRIAPSTDGDDAKKLIYSLNTLESFINIAPAHQAAMNDEAQVEIQNSDANNLFYNVIINSNYYEEGTTPPAQPTFGENISLFKKDGDQLVAVTKANLEDDALKLYAEANVADSGTLIYTWYYGDKEIESTNANYVVDKYEFIPVEAPKSGEGDEAVIDWSLVYRPGQRYYKALSVNPDVADESAFERVANVASSTEPVLYRKYSVLTLVKGGSEIVGNYCVEVTNKVGKHETLNPATSSSCVLPAPNEIKILSKEAGDAEDGDLSENKNFIIKQDDGAENLTLEVKIKEHADSVDVVHYKWLFKDAVDEEFGLKETVNTAEDENPNIYVAAAPGWYKAEIYSKANRKDSAIVTTKVAKVTKFPEAPKFIGQDDFDYNDHQYDVDQLLTVKTEEFAVVDMASNENSLTSEKITYQWYAKFKGTEEWVPVDNATNKLTINAQTKQGLYICVATNHLNGETASNNADKSIFVTVFSGSGKN